LTAIGYRALEVPLKEVPAPDASVKMSVHSATVSLERRNVSVAVLNFAPWGAALPHADTFHAPSVLIGGLLRFAAARPTVRPDVLSDLRRYTQCFVESRWQPLPPDVDLDAEAYVEMLDVSRRRKDELLRDYVDFVEYYGLPVVDLAVCLSFPKDEEYSEWKHVRCINARRNVAKVLFGVVFKAISDVVFQDEFGDKSLGFAKPIPRLDMPERLLDGFGGNDGACYGSDYSAFEGQFTPELMENVEIVLYNFMLSHVGEGSDWLRLFSSAVLGNNKCTFKDFTLQVRGKRMSGEMCTSLGNGFSNMIFTTYVLKQRGCENIIGLFEGDDGLLRFDGPVPSAEDFSILGLSVKLQAYDRISDASFCGNLFDVLSGVVITEPLAAVCGIAWAGTPYCSARPKWVWLRMRCAALSIAHQYPGMPVLSVYARCVLRNTRHYSDVRRFVVNTKFMSQWMKDQVLEALRDERSVLEKIERPIPISARLLVEEQFGLSVEEQYSIEQQIESHDFKKPLRIVGFEEVVPDCWVEYWERCVVEHVGWSDVDIEMAHKAPEEFVVAFNTQRRR